MAVETLFEGSTPLVRRLREEGPAADERELIARARRLASSLTEEEKIEVLNAHPRIGEDPARLSRLSLAEQGADRLPELDRLNAAYERKFGFRFVVFVNGRPKPEILEELKVRMERTRDEELATGLRAVIDIAESRIGR